MNLEDFNHILKDSWSVVFFLLLRALCFEFHNTSECPTRNAKRKQMCYTVEISSLSLAFDFDDSL